MEPALGSALGVESVDILAPSSGPSHLCTRLHALSLSLQNKYINPEKNIPTFVTKVRKTLLRAVATGVETLTTAERDQAQL